MKQTITLLAALLCSAAAWAHDFYVDGIYYNIISNVEKTVRTTYRGESKNDADKYRYPDRYQGVVEVPSTVTNEGVTYKVVEIGNGTFNNCTKLTKVIINENVKTLALHAFLSTPNLTEVILPSSLVTISASVFNGSSIPSITIPSGVTNIHRYALTNCKKLTNINVSANEKFTFDDGFLVQHDSETEKVLVAAVFSKSGEVVVPEGITTIRDGVFTQNPKITQITLPASLKNFNTGENPFNSCEKLERFIVAEGSENLSTANDGKLLLSNDGKSLWACATATEGVVEVPASVETIRFNAFRGCKKVTSVVFPEESALTTISSQAFLSCSGLTSISLPVGVTNISSATFKDCENLASISIPGVKTIKSEAFRNTGLTNITLPDGLKTIETRAFYGSKNLEYVTLPSSLTSLGDNVFGSCPIKEIGIDEESDYKLIEGILYSSDKKTLVLNLNKNITEISIPAEVETINANAFSGCKQLASVTFPAGLKVVGANAFKDCAKITSIVLPNGVTDIGDYAFMGCTRLESLTIPETTKKIGYYALNGCENLGSLTMGENDSYTFEDEILYDKKKETVIRCMVNKEGIVVLPETVTSIEASAFFCCKKVTSITIPFDVKLIGAQAFASCSSLTELIVASGNIAFTAQDNVLYDKSKKKLICCAGGKSGGFTIPETVNSIEAYAFRGCGVIGHVTFSNGLLTTIPENAFYYATGLTGITLSEKVSTIKNNAFYGCSNLTTIECQKTTAPSCASGSFASGTYNNALVSVPCGSEAKYKKATGWKSFKNLSQPAFEYEFSAVSADEEMGTVEITAVPDCGSNTASFEAKPKEGYQFVNWSDEGKSALRNEEITENTSFVAYFEPIPEPSTGDGNAIDNSSLAQQVSVQGKEICGPADMQIFNLASQNVTSQNGNLTRGIYIIKVGEQTTKVLVK